MANATIPGMSTGSVLGPGSLVSGRFQVEGLGTMLGSIVIYNAKDQKTQRPVALWAVPPKMIRPDVVNATRSAVKIATGIAHKDLVVPFGSSSDIHGTLFVATEPLGTTSVADLIEKKNKEGHTHGLPAAYQLLGHAMNAMTAAHAQLAHGAISPALLRVDAQGHVKLAGLGMLAPLVAAKAIPEHFIAPEIRRGGSPTPRADVYSLAAMLYELVTGKPYNADVPAKSLVPALPTTFDIIMENCLSENPDDRFESVAEMKGALASLVAPSIAPPPASEGLDVPVEFDIDVDLSGMNAAPPVSSPSPIGAPQIGARMSMVEPISAPVDMPRASSVDLKGLLDEATANDAPRWMFVRNGLDHGPLSARELIQAIVRNEVLEDDVVFNMDSNDRRKLTEWPQYREFAEQARDKRRKDQHSREVKSAIAEEGVSTKAKGAVAVALVIVIAMLGVVYYKTLGPGRSLERRQAELESALAHGQLRLQEGGLQVLDTTPPPTAPGHHGGGGHGGGGFAGSYEAAMNTPIEMNFGGSGPSGGTLNDREISAPLNANLQRFGSCATAEMARGGSVRQVQMRIAVGGTGAPIGVTVVSGSGAFKGCVGGIVRGLRWRAFGGPRIGFAWGFSLQ